VCFHLLLSCRRAERGVPLLACFIWQPVRSYVAKYLRHRLWPVNEVRESQTSRSDRDGCDVLGHIGATIEVPHLRAKSAVGNGCDGRRDWGDRSASASRFAAVFRQL